MNNDREALNSSAITKIIVFITSLGLNNNLVMVLLLSALYVFTGD
jgi:hypothetical protein